MNIILHRGQGEIGGTCLQVTDGDSSVLLDFGKPLESVGFSDYGEEADSKLLPPIPGIYRNDREKPSVQGVIISHYHEDHWGLTGSLKDSIPLYLPGKARDLILARFRLLGDKIPPALKNARTFCPGETLNIGSITVETHLVDHSAMDACALELTGPDGKRLFYSGDFRRHGRKGKLWQTVMNRVSRPVHLLVSEGTTLSREGQKKTTPLSETDLEERAVEIISKHQKSVVMSWCSSTNFDRITTLYRAAKRSGHVFVVDIFTAHMMRIAAEDTRLPAPDHRFPDIRVYYPHKLTKRIKDKGGEKALYAFPGRKVIYRDISDSPGKYFLLVRPSSRSWLNHIPLDGAVLLYSLWSGYKKKPGNKVFLDFLEQSGCGISTLHTSGHADAETIMETLTVLKPEKILPVHTMNPEWFDSSRPEVVHLNNSESLTI